jgi:transketolase
MAATATRVTFGETVARLAADNPDIVVLDADLRKSTMTDTFAQQFPGRFFDVGIAEGNMVGIGAGMALAGQIPFICSFSCFVVGRFEQIRMAIAYNRANVKIVGTHAGIGIGEDGYSQMATEDVGLMRTLPNMSIVQPADAVETRAAVEYIAQHDGPVFLRLTRQKVPDVNVSDYTFQFGKGVTLREGTDVTIMGTGAVLENSLTAADQLSSRGISAQVINVHTIKPIDEELIESIVARHGKIVTVEDHSINGGLGSAVSEIVAQLGKGQVRRIGVTEFAESGDTAGLYGKYGLSADHITNAAVSILA